MTVPYILRRSRKRKKTISLQINGRAEVIVSAPFFTKKEEINRFVEEKGKWIGKTIRKQHEYLLWRKEKEFISGEYFYYLGGSYPLETFFRQNLPAGLVFWSNRFYLNFPDQDPLRRKKQFIDWYKTRAAEYMSGRVQKLADSLNLHPQKVRITSARTRWGSCSGNSNLAFGYRLIMATPDAIDYVIIHELMHIREKNHSAGFWKSVEAAMPEYKVHRRWLKENGHKLVL